MSLLPSLQFDRDAEINGMEPSISDKAVLLFNQALIHMRVGNDLASRCLQAPRFPGSIQLLSNQPFLREYPYCTTI